MSESDQGPLGDDPDELRLLVDTEALDAEVERAMEVWANLFAAVVELASQEEIQADELNWLEGEVIADDGQPIWVNVKPFICREGPEPELITINFYEVAEEDGQKSAGKPIYEYIGFVGWEDGKPVRPWIDFDIKRNCVREFTPTDAALYGLRIINEQFDQPELGLEVESLGTVVFPTLTDYGKGLN